MSARVRIVMGSGGDLEAMMPAVEALRDLEIENRVAVAAARRTPGLFAAEGP